MYVRAIALALPLVLGIAACKTSSTQGSTGGQTASAEPPATTSPQTGQSSTADVTPHSDDQFVAGRVSRISSSSIAIQSEQGQEKVLELAPETLVTIGGQDATQLDLKEGQEVRASYNQVDGRDVAVRILAQPSGSTGTGTLGSPGTMEPSTPGSTGTMEPSTPGSTGTMEPSTPGSTGTMEPSTPGSTGTMEPSTPSTTTDPSTGSTGTTTQPDTK